MRVINYHTKSATTVNHENLVHGELAVIATKNYEDIYIKNSEDKIVGLRENVIEITYDNLVKSISEATLKPGMYYRIVDYVTTSYSDAYDCGSTESEYDSVSTERTSANHQFDIIVNAISKEKISNKAKAIQHSGDTYFNGCSLNKWEIWYNIDNKHGSTKGYIYRMIDEYGNDCPFDFKNILWGGVYTLGISLDDSLHGGCYDNKIYGEELFIGPGSNKNYIGVGCRRLRMGSYCCGNTFGVNCNGITLGDYCSYNKFGDNCGTEHISGNIRGGFWTYSYSDDCWYPKNFCSYNTFNSGCAPKIIHNGTSSSANVLKNLHITIPYKHIYTFIDCGAEEGWAVSYDINISGNLNREEEVIVGEVHLFKMLDDGSNVEDYELYIKSVGDIIKEIKDDDNEIIDLGEF